MEPDQKISEVENIEEKKDKEEEEININGNQEKKNTEKDLEKLRRLSNKVKTYSNKHAIKVIKNKRYYDQLANSITYKYNKKPKTCSLYQLFTSELFTMEFILEYLIQKEDEYLIDFLINLLFEKFGDKTYFYLPQLCSLTRAKKYCSTIESYLIIHSAEDTMFAVSAHWIFKSYCDDFNQNSKRFTKLIQNIESMMINGIKIKDSKIELNDDFFLNKGRKEDQFENTLEFFAKLNKICLKLKTIKTDIQPINNNITPLELLKQRRKKYLMEKINICNENNIMKTMKGLKNYNPYIGIILPFETKQRKIIVNFLPEYSFCFATKERIPVKLTMECIDADELNENIEIPEKFFIQKSNTLINDAANQILNEENNIVDMNKETKNEMTMEDKAKVQKILENIKYENEHPNEEFKAPIETIPQEKFSDPKENIEKIFNPFISLWSNTEKIIKEKSMFKQFKSLSVVSFIAKSKDDLRQEVMTMQLIKKCDEIFKSESIPLKLHPYEILVTSASSGIIEFIPDTISIDSLKKKLLECNVTFEEFFKRHFGDMFEECQKNFAESLAAYSLVSYLFAIKDRHNGNILLKNDGTIIHIDFGFILGISPGGNMNFENAPFKITKDYIRLMEGIDSSIFCYFKSLFMRGLFALRKNINVFIHLIEGMGIGVPMPCFNGRNLKDITNAVKERALVKFSEVEIVPIVNTLFERAINSWRTYQYDIFQKLTNNIQP